MRLIAHPDCRPSIEAVCVALDRSGPSWALTFAVKGTSALVTPEPSANLRADGLWRHTCFELFVKPEGGEGYFEFNFSPSTQWATYAFDGYRAGMRALDVEAPAIERREDGVAVRVDLSGLPGTVWRIGLAAVIEEADGTKSYWALAHPPGKPDFHDPACFALELPAPRLP
jgi:hypothetical protein